MRVAVFINGIFVAINRNNQQLCDVSRKQERYQIIQGRLKAGVLFLLFIFCLIPVLEALHPHSDSPVITKSKDNHSALHSYTAACPVCNFIINCQNKHLNTPPAGEIVFYKGHYILLPVADVSLASKASLLSWTNKGPPSFIQSV